MGSELCFHEIILVVKWELHYKKRDVLLGEKLGGVFNNPYTRGELIFTECIWEGITKNTEAQSELVRCQAETNMRTE